MMIVCVTTFDDGNAQHRDRAPNRWRVVDAGGCREWSHRAGYKFRLVHCEKNEWVIASISGWKLARPELSS